MDGEPTAEKQWALAGLKHYREQDSGYSMQQATRPQTLAYGLTDSPAGQAAWILEKFQAWTDCQGDPFSLFSRDELLDNVMLYGVTASAASSARLYWESFGPGRRKAHSVSVPTGMAVFPKEIVMPVRRWMKRATSATSGIGPRCRGAGISRPSNNPSCSSTTCARSFAACVDGASPSALAQQEGVRQLHLAPADPVVLAHFEHLATGLGGDAEDQPLRHAMHLDVPGRQPMR